MSEARVRMFDINTCMKQSLVASYLYLYSFVSQAIRVCRPIIFVLWTRQKVATNRTSYDSKIMYHSKIVNQALMRAYLIHSVDWSAHASHHAFSD